MSLICGCDISYVSSLILFSLYLLKHVLHQYQSICNLGLYFYWCNLVTHIFKVFNLKHVGNVYIMSQAEI